MGLKFSKAHYSKLELSNLELEIIRQALGNPNFRLLFRKELIQDTLEVVQQHQENNLKKTKR